MQNTFYIYQKCNICLYISYMLEVLSKSLHCMTNYAELLESKQAYKDWERRIQDNEMLLYLWK